jgi:hypothetical protein
MSSLLPRSARCSKLRRGDFARRYPGRGGDAQHEQRGDRRQRPRRGRRQRRTRGVDGPPATAGPTRPRPPRCPTSAAPSLSRPERTRASSPRPAVLVTDFAPALRGIPPCPVRPSLRRGAPQSDRRTGHRDRPGDRRTGRVPARKSRGEPDQFIGGVEGQHDAEPQIPTPTRRQSPKRAGIVYRLSWTDLLALLSLRVLSIPRGGHFLGAVTRFRPKVVAAADGRGVVGTPALACFTRAPMRSCRCSLPDGRGHWCRGWAACSVTCRADR